MTGICGWLSFENTDTPNAKQAKELASSLSLCEQDQIQLESLDSCTLIFIGHENVQGGISKTDGIITTVRGNLIWKNKELSTFAKEHNAAETLIKAYQDYGSALLDELDGDFVFVICDTNKQEFILARDRMGVHNLNYLQANQTIIFSSNNKFMSHYPQIELNIDPQAVFNYLFFHMIPSPQSIYKEVSKVLPGHRITGKNSQLNDEKYWQLNYTHALIDEPTENSKKKFKHTLTHCIEQVDSENTGAFLSGGTDSSSISGFLSRIRKQPISTFSIGFNAEGFDEMYYARTAAEHFSTIPHEYYVTPKDVSDAIPLIAAAYDEPFGNASAIPTYYCAKLAKDSGINTLLAGDGGDELFAGNERYAKQLLFEKYQILPGIIRNCLLEPTIKHFPFGDNIKLVRKAKAYVKQANIPLPERLEAYNFLTRTALDEIFEPEFLSSINNQEPFERLKANYQLAKSDDIVDRMMFNDHKFILADNDLRKVTVMCDLAGVEVRFPFLGREMVDFAAAIPSSLHLKDNKLRYFFKDSLSDFLPHEIIHKSKHGFGLPFGLWTKTDPTLGALAESSINSFKKRGIIRSSYIEWIHQQHQTEHASYYGVMQWIVMMLEQWFQANDI